MKYVIYARKSSEDRHRQIQSIDDQLKILRDIAKKQKIEIEEEITEERSAKEVGRQGFLRLVKIIETGKAEGVLCWDADRLARNMIDGATLSHMLQNEILKEIKTPHEIYDKNTDTIVLSIKFGMATQFIRNLKKNVERGMRSSLERGLYPTSPPLGYKAGGKGKKLTDENFGFIKQVFDLYDTGNYSLYTLSKEMRNRGMTTKTGKRVTKSTIETILKNPFYCGEIHWGRTKTDTPEVFIGQHERAISKDVFERVQDRMHGRLVRGDTTHEYLFTRKIKCGCGRFLSPYKQKGSIYIECKNRKCDNYFVVEDRKRKTIREDYLLNMFQKIFENMKVSPHFIETIKDELIKLGINIQQSNQSDRQRFIVKLQKLDEKIQKLNTQYIGAMEDDFFDEADITDLKRKKNEFKRQKTALLGQINQAEQIKDDSYEETLDCFMNIGALLSQKFKNLSLDRRRESFELLVKSLKIRNNRLLIGFTDLGSWLLATQFLASKNRRFELSEASAEAENEAFFSKIETWYRRQDSNL